MLKYFVLLLDLLEIEEEKENLVAVAAILEKDPDKNYKFFHRLGFAFEAFLSLVRGEMAPEVFMKTGDVDGTTSILLEDADAVSFQALYRQWKTGDAIYIIDTLTWELLKMEGLQKDVDEKKISLYHC